MHASAFISIHEIHIDGKLIATFLSFE